MHKLLSFLHLIKRSGTLRLGSEYLSERNVSRIALILISSDISAQSRAVVTRFAETHHITASVVPANILTDLYRGKTVKVLSVTNTQSAKKIANLMKEGDTYE